MKVISLPINALKAAVLCCGLNDIRYYLKGVCISEQSITATDGNIMFTYPMGGVDDKEYIIHSEDLKILFKNIDKTVKSIDFINIDGIYYLRCEDYTQKIELLDEGYPDVKRVISSAERAVTCSEGVKQIRLNHEYLLLVNKVTKALKLHKFDYPLFDFSTSTNTCIISYETCGVKMYCMPCRTC